MMRILKFLLLFFVFFQSTSSAGYDPAINLTQVEKVWIKKNSFVIAGEERLETL